MKQDTLCNGYKGEGRKDIGISNEIMRQNTNYMKILTFSSWKQ